MIVSSKSFPLFVFLSFIVNVLFINPSHAAIFSETPTNTPPPPFDPIQLSDDRFQTDILYYNVGIRGVLDIDPLTGNLVFQKDLNLVSLYLLSPPDHPVWIKQVEPSIDVKIPYNTRIQAADSYGRYYGIYDYIAPYSVVTRVNKDGLHDISLALIPAKCLGMHVVNEMDKIPGVKTGDLLVFGEKVDWTMGIWIIDPNEPILLTPISYDPPDPLPELECSTPEKKIPLNPIDWTIGPDGVLCLLAHDPDQSDRRVLYRLDMDGALIEIYQFLPGERFTAFTYLPADRAFYLLKDIDSDDYKSVVRIPEDGAGMEEIPYTGGEIYSLVTSLDGTAIFLLSKYPGNSMRDSIQVLRYKQDGVIPTPTIAPTNTPAPTYGPLFVSNDRHESKILIRNSGNGGAIAVHPITGNIVFQDDFYSKYIYSISPPDHSVSLSQYEPLLTGKYSSEYQNTDFFQLHALHPDGWTYGIDDNQQPEYFAPSRLTENGYMDSFIVGLVAEFRGMLIVKDTDNIPGAEPWDILVLSEYEDRNTGIRNVDPYKMMMSGEPADPLIQESPIEIPEVTVLLPNTDIPKGPIDWNIGPGGTLHLLTYDRESNRCIVHRLDVDRNFREVFHFSPGEDITAFAYLPAEGAFYFLKNPYQNDTKSIVRIPEDGSTMEEMPYSGGEVYDITTSLDGTTLYLLYQDSRFPDWNSIQALQYVGEKISFTPTSTPTPTVTPTFAPVLESTDLLDYDLFVRYTGQHVYLTIHPITGDLVFQDDVYSNKIFSLPPLDSQFDLNQIEPFLQTDDSVRILLQAIHPDGWIYGIRGRDSVKFKVERLTQDGLLDPVIASFQARFRDMHIVSETDTIPGTEIGDVLVLAEKEDRVAGIWVLDPNKTINLSAPCDDPLLPCETPVLVPEMTSLLPDGDIPICPKDWTIGPGGALYLLTHNQDKVYRLDMDKQFREVFHFPIGGGYLAFTYLPADRAFYFLKDSAHGKGQIIVRIEEDGTGISEMRYSNGEFYGLTTSLDGTAIYLLHHWGADRNSIQILRYKGKVTTPTPTPFESTPAPTPIPGWFVLDGFGGIHSTNPELERPVLPYFAPYNIVRDIEPDPLGRGWYMLDGLGVVHTSSPDLPYPIGLPYFGFDIARNLEIISTENGLEFYMLDGFGVVHTSTGDSFEYGNLPWFGADLARELEPGPNGKSWLVLDAYGYLHSSQWTGYDLPLSVPYHQNLIARGMVRFPDETTVLIDGFGGRHTNPFYPAVDVVDGLPPEFYFWGFDIIWDIETVPATQQ